ncbi:MAG: PSD1 domain-containing protein [Pirellulales bacterium]|nr:PSD1 domain-containing protein [Pirellulales bacterium]
MPRLGWLLFALLIGCFALEGRAADPAALTFEEHIRPIMRANCYHCHGNGDELAGGLDVRLKRFLVAGGESGVAITPGKRDDSYLYQRIRDGEMPPTEHKLSTSDIETIGAWIDAGAPTKRDEPEAIPSGAGISPEDRQYWAFQPVVRPPVPPVGHTELVRTPIDAFLLARLESSGIAFGPEADKRTLAKRVYFNLTGLPPSADELALFVADEAPDAYERLVDRLLASPHYGERWGRHWLDAAGYADSEGYTDEDRPRDNAYYYRDYVIRSLNADKPWDAFIREQLAGDEMVAPPYTNLTPESRDLLVATGFLRMAADGTATGGIDQELARNQVVADTIKIVSSALLGMTVGCAQCHDHRYDPILQDDYYRLRAVLEPALDPVNWRTPDARRISLYTDADRALAAEVEARAAEKVTVRNARQAEFMEAALEQELQKHPEELRDSLRTAYNTPAAERTPEQVALLAEHPSVNISPGVLYQYNQGHADELKKLDAEIGTIRAEKPPEHFIRPLTEMPGQIPVTHLFHRGDPKQPKHEVAPGDLLVCSTEDAPLSIAADDSVLPTTGRRTTYAAWLTSGRHPLVARVLVNRVWMHHFGQGIVGTPSDFGRLGELPSHPELLDWLASEFVDSGWRMKQLHRLIVTSAAYRQSSAHREEADAVDPDNRLLARMSVRRLDAESVRDRILATSGVLSRKMFGPAVPVREDAVGQVVVGVDVKGASNTPGEVVPIGEEAFRRSVYVEVRRSRPLAVLRAFDAPVMETNCDRRTSSTVAEQALLLLNSEFILEQAKYFAARAHVGGGTLEEQARRAWQWAHLRLPNEAEQKTVAEFLQQQTAWLAAQPVPDDRKDNPPTADDHERTALTNFCQVLLGSNEFLYFD